MRLFITTLSMFSVIAFGYALAGYGGGFFGGAYRFDYVLWGLVCGFAFAGVAMWLWYKHRDEFFEPIDTNVPDANAPDASGKPIDLAELPLEAPDWGSQGHKIDMDAKTHYGPECDERDKASATSVEKE